MKPIFPLIRLAAATLLAFLCGALASAQEKTKGAEVIYPRTAASGDAAVPTKPGGAANTAILGVALLAAAAGGWLLWRQKQFSAGTAGAARKLAIAETRSLGNRQYLVVADYDGRKFLLGVCPGRIEMLTPLGEGDDDLEAP